MAKNKSGQTATGAAIARYIEQFQPHETRLFNDPVIGHLLAQPFKWILHYKPMRNWMLNLFNKQTTGIYGGLVCRSKYIDEALKSGIHKGFRQVVILGAGLDTRAYRLPDFDDVTVFEVDLPAVQKAKVKRLTKHFGSLPENVIYTSIDFNKQKLENVLDRSKLDLSKPVYYIWEGVTQYIPAEAVSNTLHYISKSSPGSEIVFTYFLKVS
ncbi:SAM-dependent methyltransferase [Paenibacillus sp. MMO-58]|uniref:SAM-dependent methyltransferase n=1 Tax=Paenibacillus sp. MMO-58 TaxID=3081290 RepID=UPI003017D899